MHIVGVDPGFSGAISVINESLNVVETMKLKDATWVEVIAMLNRVDRPCFAMLEQVHSMPRQGVASSFKFGTSFGGLQASLAAAAVPYEMVTPSKWQRSLGCLSKGDKNVTKNMAQRLFPNEKVIHATADSLLIAYYAMKVWKGEGNG